MKTSRSAYKNAKRIANAVGYTELLLWFGNLITKVAQAIGLEKFDWHEVFRVAMFPVD